MTGGATGEFSKVLLRFFLKLGRYSGAHFIIFKPHIFVVYFRIQHLK